MPSGRKRQQPEKPPPIFFLDRGVGRHVVAEAIRARGCEALPMADVYPNGADQRVPDDEWIERAGREGWIAITKDYSIIRDHADDLKSSRLRVFAFNNASISGDEMASRLDRHFNRILRRAAKAGPYVYVIGKDGLERRWPPNAQSSA